MRNHHEKPRDMARSVLPSTRRRSARTDLRSIRRRARRTVRQTLTDVRRGDPDDHEAALTDYPDGAIREAMFERRNGDKLSIVRWAERVCRTRLRGLDEDERYGYFKGLFADDLPGRHAASHVESHVAPLRYYGSQYVRYTPTVDQDGIAVYQSDADRKRIGREQYALERDGLAEKAHRILAAGDHGRLNRALKATHRAGHEWRGDRRIRCEHCAAPRLLLGGHDVEGFAADLLGRGRHTEGRDTVRNWE